MEYRSKKISIILISLLFHLFVLVLLLIFYTSPEHEWIYFDSTPTSINTPETIFSEVPSSLPEPNTSMPASQEDTWAELRPGASKLSNSMEMPEDPFGISFEGSQQAQSTESAQSMDDDGDGSSDSKQAEESAPISPSVANGFADMNQLKQELRAAHTGGKKKGSTKKRQAQKALARITRGYLEQLAHEGENLIKTIGGDPNKMPSAEQLKYERYLAKIQWCLQNAHNIHRDKCQMHEPIQTTMRVYFTLNREGKMADLKIIQSSGDTFVDRYITSLFETASSSFPPVPGYIKEDPYPLLYTVMVCWNVSNPSSYMGLMRE